MTPNIRIKTTETGHVIGTKVYAGDTEIQGVVSIKFQDLIPENCAVIAEISVVVAGCDIHAHPLLSLDSLRDAARAHGYSLTRGDD